MKKIKEMVNNLEHEELINLRKEIENNKGNTIKQMVNERINEVESNGNSICVVCGRILNQDISDHYTLIFGPCDLRKKANFCALDCLQYFLSRIKQTKTIKE